jgi:hypothetical protein
MSLSVVDGKFVVEDVCKLCALEKDFYLLDRICEDCWERMHNAD